jgi:hypothetical protein
MSEEFTPTIASRLTALFVGVGYLLILTNTLSFLAGISLVAAAVFVVMPAVVIMLVLAVYSVKFFHHGSNRRRLALSTILLAFVPISIYLAGISCLLRQLPLDDMRLIECLLIATFLVVWATVTTVILLYLVDALVW